MSEPIDTAEYRRWYGLDEPWTGGGDIAFHLGQVLDALDEARKLRCDWDCGSCHSDCEQEEVSCGSGCTYYEDPE